MKHSSDFCQRCGLEMETGIPSEGALIAHPTFEEYCYKCGHQFAVENALEKIADCLTKLEARTRPPPPSGTAS